MDNRLNKEALLRDLDGSGEIQESVFIGRKDRFDNEVVVVFVVPAALTLADATRFTFDGNYSEPGHEAVSPGSASICPNNPPYPPLQVVLVNSIPRDETGAVDEARLKSMPVVDAASITAWSRAVESSERVETAVVFGVLNSRKTEKMLREDVLQSLDRALGKPGFSPDQTSAGNSQCKDPSAAGTSSVYAQASTSGKLYRDRLDGKYSLNLANSLYRAAETSPQKGIRFIDRAGNQSFQPYPRLLEQARSVLAGLQANGIEAGDKLLLQCDDNRDFIAVFWACVLGGIVPVPMTVAPSYSKDNAVAQKLLNVWQKFEHPMIVCSDTLADAFGRLYAETDLSRQHVLLYPQLLDGNAAGAVETGTNAAPDALALLLLTSGSTGTPKAVMHTHQTLINRSAATSSFNRFGGDDISLNWMPLDHVGGIVMFHLRDVYNACSQVQVATSWILENPLRWLDAIDSERASITWAPNFAFALIVDQADKIPGQNWDLSCMRFVLNGGEAVVARTARNFLKLLEKHKLPRNSMHPAWGMSETASGVCYSHDFTIETSSDSSNAVEVGRPIPNTALRIVDAENRLLHEGEKGNLQVKGASVTPGYYLNPEANRQAFTDDGWFKTGDLGILNNGRLTITARVKDEIIVNGVNYPAAEIETLVDSMPGVEVSFTAACAARRAGSDTDALVIFFCPTDRDSGSLARLLAGIRETVSSHIGVSPEFVIPLSQTDIPKTNIGKIQRSLLRQKFELGEFDAEMKQSERMLGTNVIPGWFYQKVWRPKKLPAPVFAEPRAVDNNHRYLVFCDGSGFAAALAKKFNESGMRAVLVSIAAEYEFQSKHAYGVNPGSRSDFARLMQTLRESNFHPDVILHCWTYAAAADISQMDDFEPAHWSGINSLINLTRSLAGINHAEKQVKLFVISSDVQQCLRDDKFVNPHAAMSGLLKTLPHELAWLSVRHLDFPFTRTQKELRDQVNAVIDEIAAGSRDDEIVYRNGLRYGWKLEAEDFTENDFGACPIEAGGLILISGGLGGIGSMLARFLINSFGARLILTGRSVLPERESWPDIMRQGGRLAERVSRYLEIESLNGEFIYAVADVSNYDDLQRLVDSAEQRWNRPLNGVFHLAVGGEVGAHSVVDDDIKSYEEMFTAKIRGSLALARLTSRRDRAFMVSFGSVVGMFGEARYAAYAAANSLLGQLTGYFDHEMPGRFYQFDWTAWENNPHYALDYFKAKGYSTITAQAGMNSLLLALCGSQRRLIIGLDADSWSIRKHLAFESEPLLKLVCCFTAHEEDSDIESPLKSISVRDRFNLPSQCEFFKLERLPELPDGTVDIPALQAMVDHQTREEDELPSSALEKKIAALWCDVLGASELRRQSNFFQLGGNSLVGMQLISRLNQAFDVHLEIRDLFDAYTIAAMADLIETERARVEQDSEADEPNPVDDPVETLNAHELLANIDQLSDEQVASLLTEMRKEAET